MTESQSATVPRQIHQSAVDWYVARYGPADIERWKAAGKIEVIVEDGVENNGS